MILYCISVYSAPRHACRFDPPSLNIHCEGVIGLGTSNLLEL